MAESIQYKYLPEKGLPFSLVPGNKGHVIAKRVFSTYDEMMAYVEDVNDSAVSGLILVVSNDSKNIQDRKLNGAYLVQSIKNDRGFEETEVVLLATGKSQIITLSPSTPKDVATLENDVLTIMDMRSYWGAGF